MKIEPKKITLLYLDENLKQQEALKDMLMDKVDELIIVKNTKEALEHYLKYLPDIVLIPLDLPQKSSLELSKQLIEKNKDISIILISNEVEQTLFKNALELGIDNFIIKPINNKLLIDKLDKIIHVIHNKEAVKKQEAQIKNYLSFIEKQLTNTLDKQPNNDLYLESQRISNIGSWKHDHKTDKLFWSNEMFNILEIEDINSIASYEKFLMLVNVNDREKVNTVHKNTLKEKKILSVNFNTVLKDGSLKFLNEKCETIFDKNNKPLYTLGTIQDITLYENLYDNLSKNEEVMISQSKYATMGEIITMIMHQWRQPITTISMAASNLLVDIELEELEEAMVKKAALTVTEQTQYLSKTIDDFRSFFSNVKTIENTIMGKVINETTNILIASLKNHEIELKLNFDETITIKTFKRELLQVLINIIKNAKDALVSNNIENRFIEININENDNNIEILISDNAGGIKEEIISKIFDAYFTTKDVKTGTGLGLYMSKMIIEKNLKGKLGVMNIDGGVRFSLELPKNIE